MNRMRGTLVRWLDDKGYGFIRPDGGGRDVFVHLRDCGRIARAPRVGDIVFYQPANDGSGRFRAADVSIEGMPSATPQRRAGSRPAADPELSIGAGSLLVVGLFCGVLGVLVVRGGLPVAVLMLYGIASAVTFLVYAFDKAAAMNRRWRRPESTLHVLSLVGGWPGALLSQQLFRHKSKKQAFRRLFWATVALNLGALTWAVTPAGRRLLQALSG